VKSEYGLGKDMIFTNKNLKVFDNFDLAWNARKNIWINRYRYEQLPKVGELISFKIAVEWNGAETILMRKYTCFGILKHSINI
jgi:hypothetical protein